MAATAEGLNAAEQLLHHDRCADLNAARQHCIAGARPQLPRRQIDGDQRRSASRVQGVGRSLQVEPIRDTTGQQAVRQAGDRLRVEGGQAPLQFVAQGGQFAVAFVRFELPEQSHDLVDDHAVEHPACHSAVVEQSAADDDPGLLARQVAALHTGVGERFGGTAQGQELVGLGAVHAEGHDAVKHRVEAAEVAEKSAAKRVHRLRAFARLLAGMARQPAFRRIGHAIDAVDQVLPVAVERIGPGEDASHPHDRDFFFDTIRALHYVLSS